MWIPLEANPEVMNTFATKLLPTNTKFEFMDVFGFDEELLAMIPQPIKSLILLFPVTEA